MEKGKNENAEGYIWKRTKNLQVRLIRIPIQDQEATCDPSPSTSSSPNSTPRSYSPSESSDPASPPPSPLTRYSPQLESAEHGSSKEFQTFKTKRQPKSKLGQPIRRKLAAGWKKIVNEGLGSEALEVILKKYPTPSNFRAALVPSINSSIRAILPEKSVKKDNRIAHRQHLTGTLMSCLGRSLTSILQGNINSKMLAEEIDDAVKLAAEIHHHDSSLRKRKCLIGASKVIQKAIRQTQVKKYFCGDCAESIQETFQMNKGKRISQTNPDETNKNKNLNRKGQQRLRAHGGSHF